MALEALSSSDLFNFIMYDSNISASATPFISSSDTSPQETINGGMPPPPPPQQTEPARKKRRRRPKVCKNKEEAETQRMTHIAVERNRRKQMNEHLAVLRSLMPDSYVQRGDQASIVGGAIEFVKELEHILQTLEAKKFALLGHHAVDDEIKNMNMNMNSISTTDHDNNIIDQENNNKQIRRSSNSSSSPFGQFFAYPQFSCSSQKYTSQTKAAIADIEVTLIETHANIRVLSRRRLRQLSKIVASFHAVFLTILHLNVTTLDDLVLYSISAKVEEGCQLNSADDIAAAVHHMLRIIEEEAILGCET